MIIGVDPGVKGGIAAITDEGAVMTTIKLEGMSEREVTEKIRALLQMSDCVLPKCFMEKVGYIKGDGGMGAFTFGRAYGTLRGIFLAVGVPVFDVYPTIWQSRLECLSGGNKNVTKNRATELFPDYAKKGRQSITHGNADALLIAEYGRRFLYERF